ncbi:MAG: hypothetical protein KGN84_12035 [Acidobacteriota bacterium]|nr:hypothetical protein [Acidobacteriota bacterium]
MDRPYYAYILSLPERVVRSLGGLCGGLLHELGEVAIPAAIRRTTLYRMMVGVTLRFLIEQLGQVEGVYPTESGLAENFILRRTASHGIELLGILAFRTSPIWVLAALADLTGGGHRLIREIADELKKEGLLEPEGGFQTMEQILGGLEKTSEHLALTLNMPPVNVSDLRKEWDKLTKSLLSIPPDHIPALWRLERTWDELRWTAEAQERSIFAVSSLLAISTVAHVPANLWWLSRATASAAKRTGVVLGEAILDHYAEALGEIGRAGFLSYWQREFRPYLKGAAEQFSRERLSSTEKILRLG